MIIEYPFHVIHDDDLQIIMKALYLGRSMTVATLTPHATFREAIEIVDKISFTTSIRTAAAKVNRKEQ